MEALQNYDRTGTSTEDYQIFSLSKTVFPPFHNPTMRHRLSFFVLVTSLLVTSLIFSARAFAQVGDTTVVQTLTLDSIGRAGVYHFPDTGTFEKVLLEYTMRCHHALVSNSTNTEQGCGQWDYNCETYLWDSTRTDSLKNVATSATVSNYPANTNFPYTRTPTFSVTRRDEKIVTYPAGTSFITIPGDTTATAEGWKQEWNKPYQRTVYLLPASKHVWNGIPQDSLVEGFIFLNFPGTMQDFRIRLHAVKPGSYDSLSLYSDTSFTEVYHASTIGTMNPDTLFFYKPFAWDTASDLVVELSWSGDGTSGAPPEHALSFGGSEFVPVPPATLDQIYDHLTIAFWAFGDTTYLPGTNSVLCEGLDVTGHRQINIHLPWGDDNVYWDCGGDTLGNFDRIQKSVPRAYAAGRWNHWAFTKDATSGRMSIYLNGALWMTDTGKRRPIVAAEMQLGKAISSGIGYYGDVREFTMFTRTLDSNQVRMVMTQDSSIAALQPISYFKLDEGSGTTLTNSAEGKPNATVFGTAVWHIVRGKDLPNNFAAFSSQLRSLEPRFTMLRLAAPSTPRITDRYTYDSIPDQPHLLMHYRIGHSYAFHQNDTVVTVDTASGYYLATKRYVFDETGKKVDSVNVAAQDTVRPTNLYYWTRGPQKFELMSFVTPYGIGLDLGKAGKTWEFEATDYLPVLKGWKRLTMERGSGQEEFDLTFLFIKGTPPRNVLDMQQLWPMTEENYQTIQSDLRYPPLRVYLNPNAAGYKLRSYITGHGQQGEFIPQNHYLSVNGTKYERLVYKICSLDPLYPQGGTWTYDRSGWCPGMATDLAEYEITGTVHAGDSATFDYGVEPGPTGDSRYDPGTQLMSYGAPNFKVNAGIVDVFRPSPKIQYGRINPACDLPIVMIRNNGSDSLHSLRFTYYVDGGPQESYIWSGHLGFLDTTSVTLPIGSLGFWTTKDTGNFHVDISEPNGGTDEYDHDNHYTSVYTQPPQYTGTIVLNLRTNNHPDDNYYEVLGMAGDTVFSNGGFDPNTVYYDSLILPVGCYTIVFHDDGENGLYYWADTSQHPGAYLRLRQSTRTGKTLYTVNNDFGKGFQYDFSITQSPLAVSGTPVFERIGLYPNPTSSQLNIDLDGMPAGMIALDVTDALGRQVRRIQTFTDPLGTLRTALDLTGCPPGNYYLRVTTRDGETVRDFVVQ